MIAAAVRAASVPPFHAMAMSREATEREAAGERVFHLEVGQPSTPLPALARRAVEDALDHPLGYTNAAGLEHLRARLAERYHASVDPARVLVVGGASAGFTLAFLTLFEPGDRVGVVEPGYPCYRNTLLALGIEPVALPVGDDTRWAPTPALIDSVGHLDGLVLASPSNPTGTVLGAEALAAVTEHCRANDIAVIADEIYHGIVTEPAPQVLDHHDEAFVVNSFSKYYSMTGWRIGWVVVPEPVVDTVERLQQNFFICAPHVSQVAALGALDAAGPGGELEAHVERYRRNRRLVVDGLAAAGIDHIAPADGAFYVYAHVPELTSAIGIDSLALCRRWLTEIGVCATPGIDFDLARGHEYVRFSYAGSADDLGEACERLAAWTP
jgi:aspartate/methionine/tyrosine aminotransferase